MSESIPVAEGLFVRTADGPRLLGSRCAGCGSSSFPAASICRNPDCQAGEVLEVELGPYGTLWSWAIQNYQPPAPTRFDEPYEPYAIGLVDLEEGLRVVAQMSVDALDSLRVGSAVELTLEPLYRDEQGRDVVTWKFRPR